MHVWKRLARPENVEMLLEKLAHLDATRLAVTRRPGHVLHQIQYFAETAAELLTLPQRLGGSISEVRDHDWLAQMQKHPPIAVRDRFLLVETFSENPPPRREIMIPAGFAFGTGDHPTTATCLRFLCDVSLRMATRQWSMLDIGTGTGLLAIAAKLLGADPVLGFDYDERAVRTARENEKANHVQGIRWQQVDLLQYRSTRTYDVVAANIYSELFLAAWPTIQRRLTAGGFFILSGILKVQGEDCRRALSSAGFTILKETGKGKWLTFLASVSS